MPLGNLTGALGKKRAAHLLRRTSFGASIAEIDLFAGLTAQEAFDRLLSEDLPDPPLPLDPAVTEKPEWVIYGTSDANSEDFDLSRFLNTWMIGQALGSDISNDLKPSWSFRERMVFFFHTLFTTKHTSVNSSRAIYYQQALFRKYAFDRDDRSRVDPESTEEEPLPDIPIFVNLRELTKKVCVDNAMLVFLDGRLNVRGNPNENFARELLELYSIGRGLEGNVPDPEFDGDYHYFTEQDVQEAAKVLSGFNFDDNFRYIQDPNETRKYGDPDTELPRGILRGDSLVASQHDNTTKQFSVRFGGATIEPNSGLYINGFPSEESVLDEIGQLVDLIYDQDQTTINICRRIYRFFVYHEVTPELEADIIQEMADIFRSNDFKLHYVLEALFTSEHFYEGSAGYTDDSFGGLIKSPYDLVVGFHKNMNLALPEYTIGNLVSYYEDYAGPMNSQMSTQGMDFYDPFEVAGYKAYHQYPIYNRSWITTNYLTNRYQFITDYLNPDNNRLNPLNFVQNNVPNGIARNARSLIIYLAEYFLPLNDNLTFDDTGSSEITSARLEYFRSEFFKDQLDADAEEEWTNNWDNNLDSEKLSMLLVNLFNALLQSPEYQLM